MAKKQPKTILDMIVIAIRSQPPNPNGVSRMSISKYLKSEFSYEKSGQVKAALKKAAEKGKLIQTGQSFRVSGDPVPECPAEPEVRVEDVKEGTGDAAAKDGDEVVMKYEGKLDDGTVFDSANRFEFLLGVGEVIKGWDRGIVGMRVGGKRKLFVPAKLAYGKRGSPPDIPPNSDLHFKVTLKEIK